MVSKGARVVFYEPYAAGRPGNPTIRAETGEASREVVAAVQGYLSEIDVSERKPARLFRKYKDKPQELAMDVFTRPSGHYYNLIAEAVRAKHGKKNAGRLLMKSGLEAMIANPLLGLSYLGKTFFNTTGGQSGYFLFYQLMLSGQYSAGGEVYGKTKTIGPENGPATRALIDALRAQVYETQDRWRDREPALLFAKYAGNPEGLIKAVLEEPNHTYHWYWWNAGDYYFGPVESARLFKAAALEGYARWPSASLAFWDNMIAYLVGPATNHESGYRLLTVPRPYFSSNYLWDGLSEQQKREVSSAPLGDQATIINGLIEYIGIMWLVVKPLLMLAAVALFIRAWRSPPVILVWALLLYNAAVVSVFAEAHARYVHLGITLTLLTVFLSFAVNRNRQPD